MITRVHSQIFTNSPYIWFSNFFETIAIIAMAIFWKFEKSYIGCNRKNPRIHPSYDLCDFSFEMTIKAQKWKFWNFSEFTLFLRDSKNSKFNKFSVKIIRCFFAIIAHFACKTKSRENASFEGFFGMFRSQPHIMTHK